MKSENQFFLSYTNVTGYSPYFENLEDRHGYDLTVESANVFQLKLTELKADSLTPDDPVIFIACISDHEVTRTDAETITQSARAWLQDSRLFRFMPKSKQKVSTEQVETVRQLIDIGLQNARLLLGTSKEGLQKEMHSLLDLYGQVSKVLALIEILSLLGESADQRSNLAEALKMKYLVHDALKVQGKLFDETEDATGPAASAKI